MKKILGSILIAAMAIIVFVSTKTVNQSGKNDLSSLANLNTANAECPPYQGLGQGLPNGATGHCDLVFNQCSFDALQWECEAGYD